MRSPYLKRIRNKSETEEYRVHMNNSVLLTRIAYITMDFKDNVKCKS